MDEATKQHIQQLEPVKWVDRCKPGASYLEMITAMESEIKELRILVAHNAKQFSEVEVKP